MTGPELRALRHALGLTQKQLGERLGISGWSVRMKESERAKVSKRDEIALESIRREQIEN